MRHRRRGRILGRSPSHRRAMLRNLASSLFLTERDDDVEDAPKTRGRVVTTLHKAKEVRPLVERCITIARHSLPHAERAREFETDAERHSEAWKSWRKSEQWQKWCEARAPVVAAQRRALELLGDKTAVRILFDEVAPRFADRPGGYTRIMRLATPRLGDAGTRAVLELVGVRDRVTTQSERPVFDDDLEGGDPQEELEEQEDVAAATEEGAEDDTAGGDAVAESPEDEASQDEETPEKSSS